MAEVKRIFMTGEAGYHNLGDEAMALASAQRLKHYFPQAELVATGLDPHGAVLRHQARIVPWPLLPGDIQSGYPRRLARKYSQKFGASEDFLDPFARPLEDVFRQQYKTNERFRLIVEEIEAADLVFDMGHGALNDTFSPFMLCVVYYIAGKLNKPLFISGQSVGPLWRHSSMEMLRRTLPLAHTVGLRDVKVSRDVLTEQLGLLDTQVNMVEVGDDTLDLSGDEPDWREFPVPEADLIRSGEFVSIQWRSSDYSQQLSETNQIIQFANLVKTINQQTLLPVVFVPLSWETHHSDIVVAARIRDFLGAPSFLYVLWNYLEAPEVKWVLGRAKFGVGLSYHFHVLSLSQGVPTIPLYTNSYYKIKLKGAVAAFGYTLAPLAYPINDDDYEHLPELMDGVMNWTASDCSRLIVNAENARLAWHQAFQRFIQDHSLQS